MEIKLEEKTRNALFWIVGILNKNNIPYRIGGGFAAHIYGSKRPINDIDISLSGKYFPLIVKDVTKYIVAGPKHYLNAKWDCETLSLNYFGQEIDITDIDTLRMSNKEQSEWFQTKDKYRMFPNQLINISGLDVSLIDSRDLVGYKRHLDGDHQLIDIEAVEQYIANHNLQ